jgi:hypothetical protein
VREQVILNRQIKIISFPNTSKYSSHIQEIEDFRNQILAQDHKNDLSTIVNYSKNNFVLSRQLAFSIAYFNNLVIAISSVFSNEVYFPADSVRLLNRFYIHPSARPQIDSDLGYKSKSRSPVVAPIMAQQQLEIIKELGIEWAFLSREMPNLRWVKMFCNALNHQTTNSWKIHPNLCAICEPQSPRCWHHIIYSNTKHLETDSTLLFANEKSIENYRLLFGINSKNRKN